MLVLSRKTKESIMIGDDIEVTVLSTTGSQVRIGIAAPADVTVHREELYKRIKAELEEDVVQEKQAS